MQSDLRSSRAGHPRENYGVIVTAMKMGGIPVIVVLSIFSLDAGHHFVLATDVDAYEVLKFASVYGTGPLIRHLPLDDVRLVESWMGAGLLVDDRDADSKCSVGYLRQLKDKIEQDLQNTRMINVEELYFFAELDLLSSCADRAADLVRQFDSCLEREITGNICLVSVEFNRWQHPAELGMDYVHSSRSERAGSLQTVAEWTLMAIGTEYGLDRDNFISAWKHGQCETVFATMSQPQMQPLERLIEMLDEVKFDPYKLHSNVSGLSISFVQYCRYFRTDQALIELWNSLQTSSDYQDFVRDASTPDAGPSASDANDANDANDVDMLDADPDDSP